METIERSAPARPGPLVVLALGLVAALAGGPGAAAAQDEAVWKVEGALENQKGKKSRDVSGIACTTEAGFPRACLVIDDNRQSAQLVTLKDGEMNAGESVKLIENAWGGEPMELDGEGVAYANGFFYVMGSHGHPRHLDASHSGKTQARTDAASQLIRIRVDPATGRPLADASGAPDIAVSARLRDLIAAEPKLRPFAGKPLEENGVTVEGIAILGGRLFAGFRGPVLPGGRAVVLSASLPFFFSDAPPAARLHLLGLGAGQGVRDLAPYGRGLLVLSGPMADTGGRYAIHWWDGAGGKTRLLKNLARYTEDGQELKPEALLPLDETARSLRVLVLFDGAREGGPRAIEVPKPKRR